MDKKPKKGAVEATPVIEVQALEEDFIGSALQPQPDAPRPKTTPYTTCPITVLIGPEQRQYYVPQSLLQNPQWIASASSSWDNRIHLPDLDEGTGHVLVHYLHTGAYQTIDDVELSPDERVRVEFKRAVLAYIAAKKYMLHGLQRLAGQEISTFGAEMNIFDIVEAINKDFAMIPDDATWFHRYMGDKARTAFDQDHTIFAKDDLFRCIDNVALIRVLAKVMVEVYSNELSVVLSKKDTATLDIPEECAIEADDLPNEELPTVDCVNTDEAPAEECPAEVLTTEDSITEGVIKEAPAPEAFAQAPPEIGIISLEDAQSDGPRIKLKKKNKKDSTLLGKKKKKASAKITEALPAELQCNPDSMPEPEPGLGKEYDARGNCCTPFDIEIKEPALNEVEVELKTEGAPPLTVEQPTLMDTENKGVGAVTVEAPLPLPPPPEPAYVPEPVPEPVAKDPSVDLVASLKKISKKKKTSKKKGALSPPPPPPPELVSEPVAEKPPPLANHEPGAELAEHHQNDNEQVLTTPLAIPRSGLEPELASTEGDEWDLPMWGTGMKKQKSKQAVISSPPLVQPPLFEDNDPFAPLPVFPTALATISAQVKDNSSVTADEVDLRPGDDHVSPPMQQDQPVESDSGYCSRRSKHLAKGDRWKTCTKCRAFLRELAVELVRTSSPSEPEYEIVDRSPQDL